MERGVLPVFPSAHRQRHAHQFRRKFYRLSQAFFPQRLLALRPGQRSYHSLSSLEFFCRHGRSAAAPANPGSCSSIRSGAGEGRLQEVWSLKINSAKCAVNHSWQSKAAVTEFFSAFLDVLPSRLFSDLLSGVAAIQIGNGRALSASQVYPLLQALTGPPPHGCKAGRAANELREGLREIHSLNAEEGKTRQKDGERKQKDNFSQK